MKSPVSKFLVFASLLTILCAFMQWEWNQHALPKWQIASGFVLLGIFAISSTGIHLFLLHSAKSSGNAFVRNFMAATSLKFFFYLSVLVVLLLYSNDNKQALVIHFLFYYFVFTVFEIGMLYGELNRKKGD